MSLSIGQNAGYINTIESGKAFPSMTVFFYICEYLDITPAEFFDYSFSDPAKLSELTENLKKLSDSQLESISQIVKGLVKQ